MLKSKSLHLSRKSNWGAVLLSCALLVIMLSSVAQSRGMTEEDVANLQYAYEIAISPDGQLIAYTLIVRPNPLVEEDDDASRHLYVTDLLGNARPYITGKVRIKNIAFTPDGRYITYIAERKNDNGDEDKNDALYKIPVAGGESQKIIEFATDIKDYSWAPDGEHIAFLAKDSLTDEQDELEDKGFDQEIYEEDWRHVRVWILDTTDPEAEPRKLDLPGTASDIIWSPDGNSLAMALAPTPLIDDAYMYQKVTTVDAETGGIIYKFDNVGKLGDIIWSPDSKQLAIISGSDIHDPKEGEIYILDAEGSELQPVMTDIDGHVRDIFWIDSKTILYLEHKNVHSVIGTINTKGTVQKILVSDKRPVFNYLKLSENKRDVVMLGDAPTHPGEVFRYRINGDDPTRLTNSNPWLDDLEFGEQEVVQYNARDGLELYGMLIRPIDEVEGQRYPLIVYVHGGPEAHNTDGWLTWYSGPGQVGAAKGYMVFYPNYRGSTGRGIEFSEMGQADYAGKEFDDVVDAVDHLVEIGLVDKDKVGVTGGSYGGYATAWCSTALSEYFAAGVMRVGVSDLISKFGTTDIPMEMYYIHAQFWPWEKWQWYLEQSPIYHAGKGRTPLLIMHGEDDTRVHPSQSMELYRYLKTHGNVPVRLIFYQDEGHGTGKAAARYDTNLRLFRWMDHYLKGPGGDPPPIEIDYSGLKPEDE